uniref:Uncharacterized protein n=1 Tax=Chromera velia CCMP2878 TaxID=1169474 RepID=A0A0G4FZM9_9ALVE|eukprot:Cvel_3964.t1-p1 / transcript=Cvel_3964.t1 / gene=Cvel_3964 / organism=Chromera_velia_CCMP2878 / gene_product=hypothetical protein / transcript_product=hypothetical protein / location=Cvel_scaffold168:56310-57620(-) / protein_length=437 / sequence_SO=supercontig / SO=protein_coding / is_pseudo=false
MRLLLPTLLLFTSFLSCSGSSTLEDFDKYIGLAILGDLKAKEEFANDQLDLSDLYKSKYNAIWAQTRKIEKRAAEQEACVWYHGTQLYNYVLLVWEEYLLSSHKSNFLDSISLLRVYEDGSRWPRAPRADECFKRALEGVHDALGFVEEIRRECRWFRGDHENGIKDSVLSVNLNLVSPKAGESAWQAVFSTPPEKRFAGGGMAVYGEDNRHMTSMLDSLLPSVMGRDLTEEERRQVSKRLEIVLGSLLFRQRDHEASLKQGGVKSVEEERHQVVKEVEILFGPKEAQAVRQVLEEVKRPELPEHSNVLLALTMPSELCQQWAYFAQPVGAPNEECSGRVWECYQKYKNKAEGAEMQARIVLERSSLSPQTAARVEPIGPVALDPGVRQILRILLPALSAPLLPPPSSEIRNAPQQKKLRTSRIAGHRVVLHPDYFH